MNQYLKTLAMVSALSALPLVAQRKALASNGEWLASPEKVSRLKGEQLHSAGMILLESIHAELPESKRFEDIGQDQTKERTKTEITYRWKKDRPPLTVEYLKSIGYPIDIS